MTSRRGVLRTVPAVLTAGFAGCTVLDAGDEGIPSRWTIPLPAARFGTHFDGESLAVTPGTDHRNLALVGIDPETGDHEWEIAGRYDDQRTELRDLLHRSVSLPAVADETVYTVTDRDRCCALDAATGDLEWHTNTPAEPWTLRGELGRLGPMPFDDLVCVVLSHADDGDGDEKRASVHALDSEDGDERFRYELDAAPTNSPVAIDTSIVVPRVDGTLEAIGTDGEQRWSESLDDDVVGLTAGTETIYAGGVDETLYALDRDDGTVRWRTDVGTATAPPTLADDTVLVGTETHLEAFDADDGDREWRTPLQSAPTSVVANTDRVLSLGGIEQRYETPIDRSDHPHTLTVHERDTGTVLTDYEYEAGDARPVEIAAIGGQLYLSIGGFLSAVDLEAGI